MLAPHATRSSRVHADSDGYPPSPSAALVFCDCPLYTSPPRSRLGSTCLLCVHPRALFYTLIVVVVVPVRLRAAPAGHRARNQWATPEIDGTWLEGLYTGAATLLTLQTQRVDVIMPYCLVCGLDNAPSFTAGPPYGAQVRYAAPHVHVRTAGRPLEHACACTTLEVSWLKKYIASRT